MPLQKQSTDRTADAVTTETLAADRSTAQTELDRLSAGRPALLINGSDADLEKNDESMRRLRSQIERADARIDAMQRETAATGAAEEQARRTAVYEAARVKANAAAAAISRTYPKIVKDVHTMLRTLAEAQLVVAEANETLPDGVEPIVDPEMVVRAERGLPHEVVSDEQVELWARLDQNVPVDAAFQDTIYDCGHGWGKRVNDEQPAFRLRRFHKVTYRESGVGSYPLPLAAAIQLPNIKGDTMAWGENFPVFHPGLAAAVMGFAEPQNVLARLAETEAEAIAKPVKVERPLKVKWVSHVDVVPLPTREPRTDTTSIRDRNVRFGSSLFATPNRAGGRR